MHGGIALSFPTARSAGIRVQGLEELRCLHKCGRSDCRAFYPLTKDLNTYPLPLLSGNGTGAYLAEGGPFGHAVLCRRAENSSIKLDAVPYASMGGFSVNFWFRPANISGEAMQYLFSQAIANDIRPNGAGPNQVTKSYISIILACLAFLQPVVVMS